MFIDELKIKIKAGDGGNGVIAWLHEKGKEFGGPAGGDGGKGADVYIRGVRDIGKLSEYKHDKEFRAERGDNGRNKNQHGKSGEALVIDLPIGSIVTNLETGEKFELLKEDDKFLILNGGRGGHGNQHFKGSRNVYPDKATPGERGEEAVFEIELRLVVDGGFVGLPNAGKSSLLNELTNASAKVGAYQFTTLEPNLGSFYGFVLADIPGLIEGASEGRGLGHKFLRHIERTRVLFHCVSLENDNIVSVYKTVRQELEEYDQGLIDKPEIVILTKTDVVSPAVLKKQLAKMQKLVGKNLVSVSILDDDSIKALKDKLFKLLKKLS